MSRFQKLQSLFHDALELPESERSDFLARACGDDLELRAQVQALLEQDSGEDDGATLVERVAPIAQSLADSAAHGSSGDRIGGYRLLREIGRGGMGTVFLAERDDSQFRHRVAIKLVRGFPTAAVLERFRRERELLATLRHPNIARLFDGGTVEGGQPYLVMEHVDGVPLDQWCRDSKPSLRQRLKLFQSLCSAVQHAHQQLIVHRDLKPANVLVRADGEPVLLDFGIGKLLVSADQGVEETQLRALTPAYASPEQLQGRAVTTLSDVYGLGLILFELLTGAPLRKSSGETTRLAASRVAARSDDAWLRQDARTLRGDLDNIVRKALREEPDRRYASAGELAADIEAWFQGRPVLAAPDAWHYRMGKFVARHPVALGATAATIVILVLLSLRLAVERDRAVAAQQLARLEAEGANQSAAFLVELFRRAAPETTRGEELTVRALIQGAREELEERPFSRPEIKARLERSLGTIYISLGLNDEAVQVLQQARDRLRDQDAADESAQLELGRIQWQLARSYALLNQDQASRDAGEHALAIMRAHLPEDDPEIGHSLTTLGVPEVHLGLYEQARERFEEAERLFRLGDESYRENVAAALHNQGWVAGRRGDLAEGIRLLTQALNLKQEVLGSEHPSTFVTLQVLAGLETQQGRRDRALARLEQMLVSMQRVLGEPSERIASTHSELGSVLQDLGRYPEAERHYRAALAQHQQLGDAGSVSLAVVANNLGTLLEDAEDLDQAEQLYRNALQMRIGSGAPARAVARGQHNLARLLTTMGQLDEAQELADAALLVRRDLTGPGQAEQVDSLILMAAIQIRRGDLANAEAWLSHARDDLGDGLAGAHRFHGVAAALAVARGNPDGALQARRDQLAGLEQHLSSTHPQWARVRIQIAGLADEKGSMVEEEIAQARQILERNLHPDGPTRAALSVLDAP